MAGDQEGGAPGLQLLDKVRVGQAARPGPHLQLGERELDVELPEVGEDQLRHRAGGNLGHHAPVHGQAGDVDNVESQPVLIICLNLVPFCLWDTLITEFWRFGYD